MRRVDGHAGRHPQRKREAPTTKRAFALPPEGVRALMCACYIIVSRRCFSRPRRLLEKLTLK
jgi:hypothetical protein